MEKTKCSVCGKPLILIYGDQIEPFYIHPIDFCNGGSCGWTIVEEEPNITKMFAEKYPVSEEVKKMVKNEPRTGDSFIKKVKNIFKHKRD